MSAFAQRAGSGLLVPAATIDKQEYVMAHVDFLKLRRLMALAREYDLTAMFFCQTCKEPVKLTQAGALITDGEAPKPKSQRVYADGRTTLACQCSQWTIR